MIDRIKIPEAYQDLMFGLYTYYAYYGGRAAAKTWSIATALILLSMNKTIKILCCREILESIEKSVWSVIVERIKAYDLTDMFDITRNHITCKLTGSTFLFAGLFRNIESIKSIPGITHTWINEAATVSEESLELLIPTVIREGQSCLIVEWNPCYEDDPVWKKFVINTPPRSLVKQVSWRDNPFLSQESRDLMAYDFSVDPVTARHVWEGELKHYGARVWHEFNEKIHVREFNLKDVHDYKTFHACDPHTSFYSAAIWGVRWKVGSEFRTWVCREWPTFSRVNAHYSDIRQKLHWQGTVKDLATEFYASETGLDVTQRYIDTRFAKGFGSKQSNLINTTEGIVQDFAKRENGGMLFLMPQELAIDNAKDHIKKDMQYNTLLPLSSINEPKFYVSASCKNFIRAMKFHRYEEEMEKESETYKDFSDCARILYAGLGEFRWPVKRKSGIDMPAVAGGWMG